tara:strand:- start:13092 stop:14861 length:1770 start_codon:yes stop_codon:yes gene_type:complete
MAYEIEERKIKFENPPAKGTEVNLKVSTQQSLNGFADPRSFYPRRVNEVDTNRLAVNDATKQHPVVNLKRQRIDDLVGEPETQYASKYPYNHVKETESGHIVEFDDTPGHERIHEYHRSGTFYEVHPDGTKVTKIIGDDYEIVHQNKKLRVRGNIEVYCDGDADLYVRGSLTGQVDENIDLHAGKNINIHAGKNMRFYANDSIEFTAQKELTATSVSNMTLQSQADMNINAEGRYLTNIKGLSRINSDGFISIKSPSSIMINGNSTIDILGGGAMNLKGSSIDLNGSKERKDVEKVEDTKYRDSSGVNLYSEGKEVDAPLEATVLGAKDLSALADEQSVYGEDDVPKSDADIKAAVASGNALPSSSSDYSYNSLDGSYSSESASRPLISIPTVPDLGGEHGYSTGQNNLIYTEAAKVTSIVKPSLIKLPDDGSIDYNMYISSKYKLSKLTLAPPVGQKINKGKEEAEKIINKLRVLAVNCLDPLLAEYPKLRINMGYFESRPGTSSAHSLGEAVDIQVADASKGEYFEIAIWIRENLPHDSIILQYRTTGSGMPWIHLGCKESGNRSDMITQYNGKTTTELGQIAQYYA